MNSIVLTCGKNVFSQNSPEEPRRTAQVDYRSPPSNGFAPALINPHSFVPSFIQYRKGSHVRSTGKASVGQADVQRFEPHLGHN